MSPTSSYRHQTLFEVNEAGSLEESPLGGKRGLFSRANELVGRHRRLAQAAAGFVGLAALSGGVKFSGDAEAAPQNRALSTKAIDACLKRAVHRPNQVNGIVRKDGKMSNIGANYINDFNNIDCLINSEKTIKTWIEMQKNNGKFVRNSKVKTTILRDEGGVTIGRNYQLNRRYTCMAGPKRRGIRFATHVTGTYEGKSLSRSYREGNIISLPKDAGFMLAGKIKC